MIMNTAFIQPCDIIYLSKGQKFRVIEVNKFGYTDCVDVIGTRDEVKEYVLLTYKRRDLTSLVVEETEDCIYIKELTCGLYEK